MSNLRVLRGRDTWRVNGRSHTEHLKGRARDLDMVTALKEERLERRVTPGYALRLRGKPWHLHPFATYQPIDIPHPSDPAPETELVPYLSSANHQNSSSRFCNRIIVVWTVDTGYERQQAERCTSDPSHWGSLMCQSRHWHAGSEPLYLQGMSWVWCEMRFVWRVGPQCCRRRSAFHRVHGAS